MTMFNPLSTMREDFEEESKESKLLKAVKNETEDFKPGSIVDRVKEELDRTIAAKRRLLEKNFINFRFDEFKPDKLHP
jgi:hypothetical protein